MRCELSRVRFETCVCVCVCSVRICVCLCVYACVRSQMEVHHKPPERMTLRGYDEFLCQCCLRRRPAREEDLAFPTPVAVPPETQAGLDKMQECVAL